MCPPVLPAGRRRCQQPSDVAFPPSTLTAVPVLSVVSEFPTQQAPVMTGDIEKGRSSSEMRKVLPGKSLLRARASAACTPNSVLVGTATRLSSIVIFTACEGSSKASVVLQGWLRTRAWCRQAARLQRVRRVASVRLRPPVPEHHPTQPRTSRRPAHGAWCLRAAGVKLAAQHAFSRGRAGMVSLPAPSARGLAAALRSHLLEVGFLDGLDEGVQAVGEGLDKDVEEGDDDDEQHVAHCRAQQQPLAKRIHLRQREKAAEGSWQAGWEVCSAARRSAAPAAATRPMLHGTCLTHGSIAVERRAGTHLPAAAAAAAQAAAPAARDNVQLATLALSLSLW